MILKPTYLIFCCVLISISSVFGQTKEAKFVPVPVPTLKEGEWAVMQNGKYRVITLTTIDGMLIESYCDKKARHTCIAIKKAATKKDDILNKSYNGNPSSQLCKELGGSNLIGINKARSEYNFCEFEDGHLIDSWSLYGHIYSPEGTSPKHK